MKTDMTTSTFCVFCGVKLIWTALFCLQAPKDFNYFNCGRHPYERHTTSDSNR